MHEECGVIQCIRACLLMYHSFLAPAASEHMQGCTWIFQLSLCKQSTAFGLSEGIQKTNLLVPPHSFKCCRGDSVDADPIHSIIKAARTCDREKLIQHGSDKGQAREGACHCKEKCRQLYMEHGQHTLLAASKGFSPGFIFSDNGWYRTRRRPSAKR